MLGYLIALVIALVLLGIVVSQLGSARPPRRAGTPLGPDKPAADEPTPARSTTAGESQKENADQKTPPA